MSAAWAPFPFVFMIMIILSFCHFLCPFAFCSLMVIPRSVCVVNYTHPHKCVPWNIPCIDERKSVCSVYESLVNNRVAYVYAFEGMYEFECVDTIPVEPIKDKRPVSSGIDGILVRYLSSAARICCANSGRVEVRSSFLHQIISSISISAWLLCSSSWWHLSPILHCIKSSLMN